MKFKKFLFLNDTPGDTGGTIDRGDNLDFKAPEPKVDEAEVAAKAAEEALKAELEKKAAEAKGDEKTDDEKTDDETDEEKAKKKDTRIPLSRHKEILEKERQTNAELAQKLKQYEGGQQVAAANIELVKVENHVMALEKQYATLLTDGELDKATAVMREIRGFERQINEYKADMKIAASEAKATEKARFDVALSRIEASFPILNPDHDDYSSEMEQEVIDLKAAYESRGLTPTQALQKAVKVLVGTETAKQEKATEVQPNVSKKDVAAERKTEAVKKTAEAVAKTPANLSQSGMNSDKMGGGKYTPEQIMGMNQREFAKLSREDLAVMRGDTV